MVVIVRTRTGRVRTLSTTGLAVVAATLVARPDFDRIVLDQEAQFLSERELRIPPVVNDVTWVRAMGHCASLRTAADGAR